MIKFKITTLLVLFVSILFAQESNVDYLIKNVSIVSMVNDQVSDNKDVAINQGRIVDIFDSETKKVKAATSIDGTGKYIMPSLSDAHVHLPSDSIEFSNMVLLNLMNGVTKIRSMRGQWNDPEIIAAYDSSHVMTPDFYLSAPPIHRSVDIKVDQLEKYVASAKDYNFDFIKILSVRDESLFVSLDSLCEIAGLPIGGHFPSNISDSLIFNSQTNCFEHLGGLIGVSKELKEERISEIVENDIFICPTLGWYLVGYGQKSIQEMTDQPGMQYIDPAVIEKWTTGTNEYRDKLGDVGFKKERDTYAKEMEERYRVLKELNNLGILLLLSPDASSKFIVPGFGVLEEMKLYQTAGLSNYNILRSATANYAVYTKNDDYGTIENGMIADFIMLDDNPLNKINTLGEIQGLFFQNTFMNKTDLQELGKQIQFN